MPDQKMESKGKDPKVLDVADSDMELNDQDLAKVAGGMMMGDGGPGVKSKTISGIDTGHPKNDTD